MPQNGNDVIYDFLDSEKNFNFLYLIASVSAITIITSTVYNIFYLNMLSDKDLLISFWLSLGISVLCIAIASIVKSVKKLNTSVKNYIYTLILSVLCFAEVYLNKHFVLFISLFPILIVISAVFRDTKITKLQIIISAIFSLLCFINSELKFIHLIFIAFITLFTGFFILHTVSKENRVTKEIISEYKHRQEDIMELNHEVIDIQETVILSVAEIIEAKSPQTGQHVKRVSEYVKILVTEMGYSNDEVERIRIASMLHDIGKLSVPAEIIEKKGRFTPEEYAIMKNHVIYGEKILSKTPGYTMGLARTIALQHHERWDGTGYLGMKGEQIDKISRIVAIADVFDALVSSRSYKKSWPPEQAYDYILAQSGKHFDPEVVECFKKCYPAMVDTLHKFPENIFD